MRLRAPQFWRSTGPLSWLLAPVGWIYGKVVAWRLRRSKPKVTVPVLCVGNLIMGGTGKTPTVIALAKKFQELGQTPHILTRGYGGQSHTALRVDPELHTAEQVGDEALLLAEIAPTWVGADRYQSAVAAIAAGANLLIMDDGLQNPSLFQDFKIAVFDGQIPLDNTQVFPAGPFREDFQEGLKRIDYLILVNFPQLPGWAASKPHILAHITTAAMPTADRYVAFAGIGYPEKFYALLKQQGFILSAHKSFADHHVYNTYDLDILLYLAKAHQGQLITTEKDLVKIPKNVRKNIQSIKICLKADFTEIVNKVLKFF